MAALRPAFAIEADTDPPLATADHGLSLVLMLRRGGSYALCISYLYATCIWEFSHGVDALGEAWLTFPPMLLLKLMGMGGDFPSWRPNVCLIYPSPLANSRCFLVFAVQTKP